MINFVKKNWFLLSLGIIIFLFIIFIDRTTVIKSTDDLPEGAENAKPIKESTNQDEQAEQKFVVDLKGEVKNPGVYEVDPNFRVIDLIKLAGGFTDNADEISVNLAQKIQDEMVIVIPSLEEELVNTNNFELKKKVRINYATKEEIKTLPGIGPAKAAAIIQYREENGPFQLPEELLDVSGIGEKIFEQLKDEIQIP